MTRRKNLFKELACENNRLELYVGWLVLVFLNAYRNNSQMYGITVVIFHPEVFRVSYFHKKWMCKVS
jgi:hypothetical protein